jgi:hypothetical protein
MATTPSTTALPAADSAQRRRTRRAIVDATARLLTDGLAGGLPLGVAGPLHEQRPEHDQRHDVPGAP